jgi:ABC-2 type transport system permease protein
MRNILLIARREFREKIRGRAFRLSTALVPALLILLITGSFFSNRSATTGRHIVVAAGSLELASAIRTQLLDDQGARFKVDVAAPVREEDRTGLLEQMRNKAIDGFLWIQARPDESLAATYMSSASEDGATTALLQTALNHALLRQRLTSSGLRQAQIDTLLKNVQIESFRVDMAGKTSKSNGTIILAKTMLEIFLLTMPILLYGMDMARSIIEEKSSRIFEVMLAVVRPGDLLAGKLVGIGAVGLTQIAIWVLAAGLISGSALASSLMSGNLAIQFTWTEGILFPVYFILGFFLYSSLFSGLAATCETVQEFQMYAPLAVLPTWFAFGIMPMLFRNPSSKWAIGASLFPATSPFIMVPRVGLQAVPAWQIAASIALLVLSIWAVLWFSSRLYRVGILMYGKRASLPEILRWLRYS